MPLELRFSRICLMVACEVTLHQPLWQDSGMSFSRNTSSDVSIDSSSVDWGVGAFSSLDSTPMEFAAGLKKGELVSIGKY